MESKSLNFYCIHTDCFERIYSLPTLLVRRLDANLALRVECLLLLCTLRQCLITPAV